MASLEELLKEERRHVADVKARAERRLRECSSEAETLLEKGREAAAGGDPDAAVRAERRVQKLRGRGKHYQALLRELVTGGDKLIREVTLARLQGPDLDILVGEIERSRQSVVEESVELLKARSHHRGLRQKLMDLNEKIRVLRQAGKLPPQRGAPVDVRIHLTPQSYKQPEGGPTFREVSDLVKHLGL